MDLPRITNPITFSGRTFSVEDLRLIRALTADCAALARTELAYTLCELVDWRRPSGRLKNHEGRLLLEHLAAKGLVTLPPVREGVGRRGPRAAPRSAQGAPAPEVVGALRDVLPLALEIVPPGRTGPSRLWRELISRYHYLGARVPVGATLRYFVRSTRGPAPVLACLGWTSAAWRIAVRDRWIGWTDAQRRQALPYLVNNSRFLILPWVHVPDLASHILGLCVRQLPGDWAARYGVRPLLLETLVDPARFRGTCYRAANWLALGATVGRGRMDRAHGRAGHAPKTVYVYPLGRDVAQRLCTVPAPRPGPGELPACGRARGCGRAVSPELAPIFARVEALLAACHPGLRTWLGLNLALLTLAMLQLWRGARSGHGALTLAAVSRALPLEEREKARSKRLTRLLQNKHLVGSALTPLLVRLALGRRPCRGPVPIVLDQTTLRGTPTLLAGVRGAGRILPVAFACFEYRTLRKSQNALEFALLLLVTASLPAGCTPLFVLDRGYARAKLLAQCRQAGIPFLVRGRRNTMVRLQGQRLALGRMPYRQGVAVRYAHVLYHETQREAVDLIIFHDPTFKEPWFLLVPPGSRRQWPTARVVALYRQRMHIELTFRDWKTHLGVRGLRLEVDIAPRLERLLLALTVAYILAVLLGAGPAARRVRADCEILRTAPRHGTRRRLSALSVGILLLSLTRFAALAARTLTRLLAALARGTPAVTLAVCPP